MEFTESPDGLAVVGAAVVGEPPPNKREAFYEMLLQANTQLYGTGRSRRPRRGSGTVLKVRRQRPRIHERVKLSSDGALAVG
jgi:hypothetical protein